MQSSGKLDAKVLPLKIEHVNLKTILHASIEAMMPMANDKSINIIFQPPDEIPMFKADVLQLRQVFDNLLSNAIKYTSPHGEVNIIIRHDNMVAIAFSDTGQGIADEELPHVFERFYQTNKARTRSSVHDGFGLGLSIVHAIIEQHHGKITVESKMGKGTIFTVFLPLNNAN